MEGGESFYPLSNDFQFKRVYQPTMDYIKSHFGHHYDADDTMAAHHREMIARCFYPSSVDQIMQNLRDEGSPFALKCLEAMERNSRLSMALALKMLRQAANLDYISCLNMEVKVASKMIETKEFDEGVRQVLLSPKATREQGGRKATDKLPNLDSFFEGASWAKEISVGGMAHALLPTRHFYERFSDHVRLWISEESTVQDDLRIQFDYEAKQAVQEQGIDVRDKGLTMQSAREHLAAKLAQERRNSVQAERMEQMMSDPKLRSNYFEQVTKEVKKLKNGPQNRLQQKVDACIVQTFEKAYLQRLQTMFDKSKEARKLERRRMFIRLKRFLFKSRCVTDTREYSERQLQRLQNYSFKLPHASEQWDKSWRDFNHPLIEKSPLYHLSKAIGRASVSPIELTREYLTNPNVRADFSMLTVNKEELLKV